LTDHLGWHTNVEAPVVILGWCRDGVTQPRLAAVADSLTDEVFAELLTFEWTERSPAVAGPLRPEEWVEMFDHLTEIVTVEMSVPRLPFTVYRAGHPAGMSWTLDPLVATRFAETSRDIHQQPRDIYRCVVTDVWDVLGVFDCRREQEVVLRPGGEWAGTVELLVSAGAGSW
jgi:hypothetical protein